MNVEEKDMRRSHIKWDPGQENDNITLNIVLMIPKTLNCYNIMYDIVLNLFLFYIYILYTVYLYITEFLPWTLPIYLYVNVIILNDLYFILLYHFLNVTYCVIIFNWIQFSTLEFQKIMLRNIFNNLQSRFRSIFKNTMNIYLHIFLL